MKRNAKMASRVMVMVGGQWGSEGKGKVVDHIVRNRSKQASLHNRTHVVRCGGPNSGHTFNINGELKVFRSLPAGIQTEGTLCYLAAGSTIDYTVLTSEINQIGWDVVRSKLSIDPRAAQIRQNDKNWETAHIKDAIGSTASGVSEALIRRMRRDVGDGNLMTGVIGPVQDFVRPVTPQLLEVIERGGTRDMILVEGTQGTMLSLLHGNSWPYCTSRDTTAGGFISECGIPPKAVTDVCIVIRTYPIRVGGNSGPFTSNEIGWEEVARRNAIHQVDDSREVYMEKYGKCFIPEFTSVTKKLRRVAEFDMEQVKYAAKINGATMVAIMGLDRLDYNDRGVDEWYDLSWTSRDFCNRVVDETGCELLGFGTGPAEFSLMEEHR